MNRECQIIIKVVSHNTSPHTYRVTPKILILSLYNCSGRGGAIETRERLGISAPNHLLLSQCLIIDLSNIYPHVVLLPFTMARLRRPAEVEVII